ASMRVRAIAAAGILVVAAIVLIVTRSRAPSHVAIAAAPPLETHAAPSLPVTEQLPQPTPAKASLELGKLPAPESLVQPTAPSHRGGHRGTRGRAVSAPPRETVLTTTAPMAAPPPPPVAVVKPAPQPAAAPAAPPPAPAPAPKPAPAAQPAAPSAPVKIPYSAYVSSRRISGEEPRIPPALRSQIEAGSALARICVTTDGRVENVTVLRATTGLEDSLRTAIRTWRYKPFQLQGRAVPACFDMPFAFKRAD